MTQDYSGFTALVRLDNRADIMTRGRYYGGWRPSSDDSLHNPTIIPPSAFDKPSIMKRYHRQRTWWGVTAHSPTMVTLHDTRFVECQWWNDSWTVKTVVTSRSSASMIPQTWAWQGRGVKKLEEHSVLGHSRLSQHSSLEEKREKTERQSERRITLTRKILSATVKCTKGNYPSLPSARRAAVMSLPSWPCLSPLSDSHTFPSCHAVTAAPSASLSQPTRMSVAELPSPGLAAPPGPGTHVAAQSVLLVLCPTCGPVPGKKKCGLKLYILFYSFLGCVLPLQEVAPPARVLHLSLSFAILVHTALLPGF